MKSAGSLSSNVCLVFFSLIGAIHGSGNVRTSNCTGRRWVKLWLNPRRYCLGLLNTIVFTHCGAFWLTQPVKLCATFARCIFCLCFSHWASGLSDHCHLRNRCHPLHIHRTCQLPQSALQLQIFHKIHTTHKGRGIIWRNKRVEQCCVSPFVRVEWKQLCGRTPCKASFTWLGFCWLWAL